MAEGSPRGSPAERRERALSVRLPAAGQYATLPRRAVGDPPLPELVLAAIGLGALASVWTWWALADGAFFGAVFYPGAVALYLLLIALLALAPLRARLSGWVLGAIVALAALAGWTALSIVWSPARAAALEDAHHVFLYAASFVIGLWLCNLLGRRMRIALVPLALAGAAAGVTTVALLLASDDPTRYVAGDGTLTYPLGYRNATAAFFLIALWPALAIAIDRSSAWFARAAALATVTICIDLAILSQSRGSVLAAAVALAVFLGLTSDRLRALSYIAIAAVPAALALPILLDVFDVATADGDAVGALRRAGAAVALGALVTLVAASFALRLEPYARLSRRAARAVGIGIATIAAAVLAVGTAVLLIREDGPVNFVEQRVSEFTEGGIPNLGAEPSRFSLNAGSNRNDFWRVSIADAGDRPLLGTGAGGFQSSYLEARRTDETPRDPHSVFVGTLGELGLPGLFLLVASLISVVACVLRSARFGPAAATVCAGALAATAYWLVHASVDWFWEYPALTAPLFGLLGAAAAPAIRVVAQVGAGVFRWTVAILAGVLALSAGAAYLSERYQQFALDSWRVDLGGAYRDLDLAADLNPLATEPLLFEAEIARVSGEPERAIQALEEAIERQPEEWSAYFFLASVLAEEEPSRARMALAEAQRLNPRSPEVGRLSERIAGAQ